MESRSLLEAVVVAKLSLCLARPHITLLGELALLVFHDHRQLRHTVASLATNAIVISGWTCDLSQHLLQAIDSLCQSSEPILVVVIENILLFYWELRQLSTSVATAWYRDFSTKVHQLTQYGIVVVVTMMDHTIDKGYLGEEVSGRGDDVSRWLDVLAVPVAFAERFDRVVYLSGNHTEVDLSRKS